MNTKGRAELTLVTGSVYPAWNLGCTTVHLTLWSLYSVGLSSFSV